MDKISSVSKGIFVFKNGPDIKKLRKKKHRETQLVNKSNEAQDWYLTYRKLWDEFSKKVEKIKSDSYGKILSNLLEFLQNIDFDDTQNLQTAVLLTGVNQTDHLKQFELLAEQISNNCSTLTTILQSRDCPNFKSAMEMIVGGFINDSQDDEEGETKLKKRQLTFQVLESWYDHHYGESDEKPKLVIMISDFELFSGPCLQDLITVLCNYCRRIPLVLVLGVATAFKALHNVLPPHITNQMDAHVFQSESSTEMLNKILEKCILTPHAPFQLSGKSFKILMDIFLFYDYSLVSFIQGYKVFMLEHFYTRPLSHRFHRSQNENIKNISDEDCDTIRRTCLSFRKWVESQEKPEVRISLIENDEKLKSKLYPAILSIERYWFQFYCMLRVLSVLLDDLPKNDLGKLLRELYPICASSNVTGLDEFKECFKLMKFTSKDKFLAKMDKVFEVMDKFLITDTPMEPITCNMSKVRNNLKFHYDLIAASGMDPQKEVAKPSTPTSKGALSRKEMMEQLKSNAKNNPTRVIVEYEQNLWHCLDYLSSTMEKYLKPVQEAPPLHEFTVFTECHLVRRQIMGAPRGALHNALTNPHHYLQCSCCVISDSDQILSTMPDTAIAYKLHLESNKFINLYDWLQAFAMVIGDNDGDEDDVGPEIQARFTRAIAELQFLGFIKQAKHKTDHVIRLTW